MAVDTTKCFDRLDTLNRRDGDRRGQSAASRLPATALGSAGSSSKPLIRSTFCARPSALVAMRRRGGLRPPDVCLVGIRCPIGPPDVSHRGVRQPCLAGTRFLVTSRAKALDLGKPLNSLGEFALAALDLVRRAGSR